jgi:hypothetical protein
MRKIIEIITFIITTIVYIIKPSKEIIIHYLQLQVYESLRGCVINLKLNIDGNGKVKITSRIYGIC